MDRELPVTRLAGVARGACLAFFFVCALGQVGVRAAPAASDPYASWTRGFESLSPTSKYLDRSLSVQGDLPDWLVGTIVRVGPGSYETRFEHNLPHWWDGFGLIHSFKLDGSSGSVHYSHQFIDSDFYNDYANFSASENGMRKNRPHTPPRRSGELDSLNTLVTVRKVHNVYMTNTETTWSNAFDLATLDTLQAPLVWDDDMMEPMWPAPAHEHTDIRTGVQYNLQAEFVPAPGYRMFTIQPGSMTRVFSPHVIPAARGHSIVPFWAHSFAMTENYLVLSEPPVLLPMGTDPNCGACVDWHSMKMIPNLPVFHRVIEKATGKEVFWFTSDAAVPVHHINAYEDRQSNSIVVDVVVNRDSDFLPMFYLEKLKNPAHHDALRDMIKTTVILRYTLPLSRSGSHVAPERLLRAGTPPLEMPRISYGRYNTRPYRYFYGTGMRYMDNRSTFLFEALYKVDVTAGTNIVFHEPSLYCQEPVFVPRRQGTAEDDGVVLATCSDHSNPARSHSVLVVLDARNMTLLTRAKAPEHIPYGFHGMFYFDKGESDVELEIRDRLAEMKRRRDGSVGPHDASAVCLELCGDRFVDELEHCEIKRDTCFGRHNELTVERSPACGIAEAECLRWARQDSVACEARCLAPGV